MQEDYLELVEEEKAPEEIDVNDRKSFVMNYRALSLSLLSMPTFLFDAMVEYHGLKEEDEMSVNELLVMKDKFENTKLREVI